MNILTFTTLWPGVERPGFAPFVRDRVAALSRIDGVDVRCVAPVPFFPRLPDPLPIPRRWASMSRFPRFETVAGIPTWHPRYLSTPWIGMRFYGDWMARGAVNTVRRLHAERTIDLIDAHYAYPDGYAAVRIGAELGIPVAITARGTDINLFTEMERIRPLIAGSLGRACRIIAVSDALKGRIVSLGIPEMKVSVVRNGIDAGLFRPRDRAESRLRLGLDADDPIALSAGALVEAKGFDRLIDAAALVSRRRFRLFIAGEGPERSGLQKRIDGLGLSQKVVLTGASTQDELACWYSAADIFCLASRREGCPNVVIESLACGTPVVSFDVGGVRELVAEPGCGIIAGGESPAGLASAIEEALARNWDHAAIAAAGGGRTWDRVAAEVLEVFVTPP